MQCFECLRVPEGTVCADCARRAQEEQVRIAECFRRIVAEFTPMGTGSAMLVWRFEQAPECLRALSTNGGDEDWLVYVAAGLKPQWVHSWIEATDACHDPVRYDLPNGAVVFIGSHA